MASQSRKIKNKRAIYIRRCLSSCLTFGGLNGYSGEKCMSRKNTPPSYTEPGGPRIVDTHSYRLSPLGPAEQFGGGSSVISANSFCIRLADVPSAFEIFGFGFGSLISGFVSLPVTVDPLPLLLLLLLLFPLPLPRPRPLPLLDPAPAVDDIFSSMA